MFEKKYLSKLIHLKKEEKNDLLLKEKILSMVCGKRKKGYFDFLHKDKKKIKKKKNYFYKQQTKKEFLKKISKQNIFK